MTIKFQNWHWISVLLDSDDDRPSRTAPPVESSAPLPVAPVTSAAALTTPAVVTNQPPEPKPLQPEHSSLSIFDDFEDLDPGLASSLTEASPDRSTQDVSSQQSQASKITLRFQLKFYPPPADPILLEMGSNPHLVKILKVLVMDVSIADWGPLRIVLPCAYFIGSGIHWRNRLKPF